MDGMKKELEQLIKRIPGIRAIFITDRDGVPLLKVMSEAASDLAVSRPAFLSTFGMATEQASKMGLSRNRSIICTYSTYQVVHFNKLPLMVSLVASNSTNTGLLLGFETELEPLLEGLKSIVEI